MTNEPVERMLERLGEDERWEVLARYVAGESDATETVAVRRWLAADPARSLPDTLTRAIGRLAFEPPPDLDIESALGRVVARLDEQVEPLRAGAGAAKHSWIGPVWLRAAAAAAVVIGGALVARSVLRNGTTAAAAALTFETPVGRADTLDLTDGSRVILAPASRLVVAAGYGQGGRGVELDGQALFSVRHDDARPFRVRSGQAMIEDLGTTFSVRNDEGGEVRVVVTEGSVRVAAGSESSPASLVLAAGDLAVVSADGTARESRGAASEDDMAWTEGRLVFRDATLSEVRSELRRWYGLDLRVEDTALEQRHLTATFEGETAAEVLNVIGLSIGANIERQGDVAVVRSSR